MFRQYWYRSGINKSMTLALQDIANGVARVVELSKGDLVVDVGCNDGTLLRSYKAPGLRLVGFEPAVNLVPLAEVGSTKIINDYFNLQAYRTHFPDTKAKVINSVAMFYDLEDPNAFVHDVAECLGENGVWVIQMSYLPSMLAQNAFDNICHEHLEYYSMTSLRHLLARHGFEIFDVELNDVNGGSFRVYVRHLGSRSVANPPLSNAHLAEVEKLETDMRLGGKEAYVEFGSRVKSLCERLHSFVKEEHERGKRTYVYGASTKGNTLLQFCGLDHTLIEAAAERNPDKWGKRTVGTMIPIISEDQARAEKPDYFLILPWHFLNEFLEREEAFHSAGGRFIVPLPEFRVI